MSKNTDFDIESLAKEIRNYLIKEKLWIDTTIYFNGKAYSTHDGDHYANNDPDDLIEIQNIDAQDYVTYHGEYLTMTFEGALYEELNYGNGDVYYEMQALFEKYGLYFEFGDAWNLSAYEI